MSFKEDIRLQKWIIGIGIFLMIIKITAFFLTGSNAILTDALESTINIFAGSFALFALILASKPKDLNHPYGHGKIEFISGGIEGTLIFSAGLIMMVKSFYNLLYPNELKEINVGIILTLVAGLINFAMGVRLENQGQKKGSEILKSGGKHLKSDGYSSAALVIGLILLSIFKESWIDNTIAIAFGLLITYQGFMVVRSSVSGIMDEVDFDSSKKIIQVLQENRKPEWIDIHNFRIVKYGRDLHIDAHVTLPYYWDLKKSHDELELVSQTISDHTDSSIEVFFHGDPCKATSCSICSLECDARRNEYSETITWNTKNVLPNKSHRKI